MQLRSLLTAFLAALLLCPAPDVRAQASAPPRWLTLTTPGFEHLGREQGLPNGSVSSLAQDAEGFLWAGTHGGLARWDGHRLRVYRAERGQPGALADGMIHTLLADSRGRLWIGTGNAGLWRYDRDGDRFTAFPAAPQRLSDPTVRALAEDGAGGLWVGTDAALDHIDAQGRVRRAVVTGHMASLYRDRHGRLWVGHATGLMRSEGPASDASRTVFVPVSLRPGLPPEEQPRAMVMYEDSGGRLWIGTRRHGVFMADGGADGGPPSTPQPVQVWERLGAHGPQPPFVTDLLEPRPGEIWVASLGHGIAALDVASGGVRALQHQPSRPSSLLDNTVRRVLRDRAGLVWVGTDQGLSRSDPTQQALLTLYGSRTGEGSAAEPAPLASTDPSAVLVQPDGRVWIGTHATGIDVIDPAAGRRVAALRPDPARPETALPPDYVLALAKGTEGQVFVATRRGVYRADAQARGVSRLQPRGRNPAAATWTVLADGDTLWLGGESDGLWRLALAEGEAGAARRVGGAEAPAGQRLGDSRITTLLRARPDAGAGPQGLWVGTRNGLYLLNPDTGAVLRPAEGRAVSGFITHLHHDRQGRLWVGSYGGGIDILAAGPGALRTPPAAHLGAAQGLPDDNANQMLEDDAGRVWVSTDDGLVVVDPASLRPRVLRRAEGVAFATYWTGSGARTATGELLFGGSGGLTIVRPEQLRTERNHPPRVLLSQLRVGEQRLPAARYHGAAAPRLQVPADANSLSVEFGSDDFSAPERIRYGYWLEGFDTGWIEADEGYRRAAYTNLPPGRYTLRLRASDRDGVWSAEALALPLRVLPAWHQTWWFRAVLGLLAAAAVAVLLHWRTRLLRRRRDELEAKVRERTAELEAMSQALEHKSRVLEQSSLTDPLTGLRNRRFLAEHIDTAIAASLRRAQDALPARTADTDNLFLLVDADHFKAINDNHGHAAGDAVLVEFAARLRAATRESDLLVRWGGEEFLVVARDTDRAHAEELAERVRAAIADKPFVLDDGRRLAVSCSIGLAAMPLVVADPRALAWPEVVELADLALLEAKRSGRNAWVVLHATASTRPQGLLQRVQPSLRNAVAAGELRAVVSREALGEAIEQA